MTPSPQQQAFYNWVSTGTGSCVLEAVAGAGKTTTVIASTALMTGDVFIGAYNKAIAEEMKGRVPAGIAAKVDVSTFHAAGFRFFRRVAKNVQVNGNKCRNLFRDMVLTAPQIQPYESSTLALVSIAKQAGLGVLRDADDDQEWHTLIDHFDIEAPVSVGEEKGENVLVRLGKHLLRESIALDFEMIDFDDMIYAPLYHDVRVWQHDWVLIDEAQDTNATRRELALRMLKRGGRLVAVGDPHQAIYGFTGADSDALDLIGNAVNAVRMPLTVTYRCPKLIVKYAQSWVSHIEAADSAPQGEVTFADIKDLSKTAKPGDAVLCRFNAPLIENVYAFIAAGIPAKVEGRDMAAGLKLLATRWKLQSLTAFQTRLQQHLDTETVRLTAKDKLNKLASLEDKVECLGVLINRVRSIDRHATVDSLIAEIDSIFGNADDMKAVVAFSSIHRSKGREWRNVVWLQTGPSPYAKKDWQQGQEINLNYVAATRAKNTLVLVALPVKQK